MKVTRRDFFKSSATLTATSALSSCLSSQAESIPAHRWIDQSLCIGCGGCVPICPMSAIQLNEKAQINPEECAECGVCYRSRVCPKDAIKSGRLRWPRTLREIFSNPLSEHKSTGVLGRGTEGIKTNDSANRYQAGFIGVFVELGRPVLGTRFREVERVIKKFKAKGYSILEDNPVAELIAEPETGSLLPEVLDEKAISALLEFIIPESAGKELLVILQELGRELETVFSVSVALRALPDGSSPFKNLFPSGTFTLPNGKVNLGFAQGIIKRKE